MSRRFPAFVLFLFLAGGLAHADVILPAVISDHAVLRKSAKTRVWGKAEAGKAVSVTLDAATAKTVAGPAWSDQISSPAAVRYGWVANPTCNLYNKTGLPALPFRKDDFPAVTRDNPITRIPNL